jgi:hypothetical protein
MVSGTPHLAHNRGLERRLRQHGRRSGLAVGLTMAAAVAVFVVGTTMIFARLQPLVSDYVSLVTPNAAALARGTAPTPIVATGGLAPASGLVAGARSTPLPSAGPTPTPTPAAFAPDLQVNPAGPAVRLRAEPSTSGGEATIIDTLPPGTALQATERQELDPAQPGVTWLEVRTAAGQQGWMRQIDTVPVAP